MLMACSGVNLTKDVRILRQLTQWIKPEIARAYAVRAALAPLLSTLTNTGYLHFFTCYFQNCGQPWVPHSFLA